MERHDDPPAGRAPTPRALIVTVYGLYAREAGGFLSVAALIRLLAELSVEEPAVRSAVSRLKRRGLLESRTIGGAAGYALSEQGHDVLREGDERIFQPPHARADDGWLLAVFSVPESERSKRHALRSRLTWLGFGTAAPGVWVAPAHRYDTTVATLRRQDLAEYVSLFKAEYLAFADLPTAIGDWWDLAGLHRQYTEFLRAYEPVLRRWRERGAGRPGADAAADAAADDDADRTAATAFADWVSALTDWRRLPYLDPGLPAELLPANWPGGRATALLSDLRDLLAEPAHRHVLAVTGGTGA